MRILLFLPSSNPAYDILSQALYLKQKEHLVIFLSITPNNKMHQICNDNGIYSDSLDISSLNSLSYFSSAYKLARFVKERKIDLILSNNLQGNFVAILSQFLHRKRTILTRHHSDYIFNGNNLNAKRQQNFVNRFGKEFISISDKVKEQMLIEGIKEEKIHRINLGFDFNLFPISNKSIVRQLKDEFNGQFKICTIARLIPLKRHLLLFETIRKLIDQGENIILWVIGDGPLKTQLKEWVSFKRLEKVIHFTNHIENSQDYLSASDLLVHISESEASSHVIREAALVETPVLVCKDVGDFDDYIIANENGFLLEKHISPLKLAERIIELSNNNELLNQSVLQLKKTILDRFDINKNGSKLLSVIENE